MAKGHYIPLVNIPSQMINHHHYQDMLYQTGSKYSSPNHRSSSLSRYVILNWQGLLLYVILNWQGLLLTFSKHSSRNHTPSSLSRYAISDWHASCLCFNHDNKLNREETKRKEKKKKNQHENKQTKMKHDI